MCTELQDNSVCYQRSYVWWCLMCDDVLVAELR